MKMREGALTFFTSAKGLSKNPLGIIALFIVLVYGFACLLFGFSANSLESSEKTPLIWFVVLFPILVLIMFGWLVSKHHDKLYAPSDYRDDKSFLATRQYKETGFGDNEKSFKDLIEYGKDFELIAEQEKSIEANLDKRNLDYSSNIAKVLIRQLAAAQVINWFDRNYNTILGSQIILLKNLQNESVSLSYDSVVNYYSVVKSEHMDTFINWDVNQYMAYLKEAGFIDESEKKFSITKTGIEFLKLLSVSGYTEKKAF